MIRRAFFLTLAVVALGCATASKEQQPPAAPPQQAPVEQPQVSEPQKQAEARRAAEAWRETPPPPGKASELVLPKYETATLEATG